MGLEILEDTSAFWQRAEALLPCLVIELVAAGTLAASARVLRVDGSI